MNVLLQRCFNELQFRQGVGPMWCAAQQTVGAGDCHPQLLKALGQCGRRMRCWWSQGQDSGALCGMTKRVIALGEK